ncbi:uncharacterized protein BDR25DRAFT_303588 [Lindgomyces ingoldianus]|uniref:Uncharacterized protein n=1 Tax=Lindgomyces ingoldianus TaxID=673940 RepID=A0ACB6QVK6_9PLEO|nr:uncharacterized protein BDR25DRAFT_303588 [Lindgomyces ingoldianus]KAF2471044.1 hypothetical protein BDR25DRAFT_303588 [Lindgomyces ingoldianus]
MDLAQRLAPFQLDAAPPDEELPDYEAQTPPIYDGEEFETPILNYHLRQVNRKLQILVPFGPIANTSYHIISHASFRLFSKKPDMEIVRLSRGQYIQESIASVRFNNDGPLPWRPRASFTHTDSEGTNTYSTESKNFTDWTVEIGGITYVWRLEVRPVSLVLSEKSSSIAVARFTYSICGTLARNGAEVGELTVYRDGLTEDREGIEKIVCGLLVALVHFKRMGRHYWNDASVRADSLSRAHLPSHSVFSASSSTL